MPKKIDMTREQAAEWLSYDPATGVFTWLKSPAKSIRTGARAGSIKTMFTTARKREYWYIRLQGVETPAARFAWLFQTGEWPQAPVLFIDDDPMNVRFDNLKLAQFVTEKSMKEGRKTYRMSRAAQQHYGLMRYYNLTGEQYGEMLAAQQGLCAICAKPETTVMHGKIKPLSVDHCHTTNRIRALLCHSCNHGLGHFMDNPVALRAAADYIEKHAGGDANVVPLKEVN